jgi:hypothetical protein
MGTKSSMGTQTAHNQSMHQLQIEMEKSNHKEMRIRFLPPFVKVLEETPAL